MYVCMYVCMYIYIYIYNAGAEGWLLSVPPRTHRACMPNSRCKNLEILGVRPEPIRFCSRGDLPPYRRANPDSRPVEWLKPTPRLKR